MPKVNVEVTFPDGSRFVRGVLISPENSAEDTLLQIQALGRHAYKAIAEHGNPKKRFTEHDQHVSMMNVHDQHVSMMNVCPNSEPPHTAHEWKTHYVNGALIDDNGKWKCIRCGLLREQIYDEVKHAVAKAVEVMRA